MKTIGVRDFLRGGYKELDEPVVVMSHSKPLGVWTPSHEEYHFSTNGPIVYNVPTTTWTSTTDWSNPLNSILDSEKK